MNYRGKKLLTYNFPKAVPGLPNWECATMNKLNTFSRLPLEISITSGPFLLHYWVTIVSAFISEHFLPFWQIILSRSPWTQPVTKNTPQLKNLPILAQQSCSEEWKCGCIFTCPHSHNQPFFFRRFFHRGGENYQLRSNCQFYHDAFVSRKFLLAIFIISKIIYFFTFIQFLKIYFIKP